jgi:hypothetical protein
MNTRLTKAQLLAEVDDVLRTFPTQQDFNTHTPESIAWLGRALAVIERWDLSKFPLSQGAVQAIQTGQWMTSGQGVVALATLLYQARADLKMEVGQTSVIIQHKMAFDYFESLRGIIESARTEVFFVDPYLDAEFVGRYLPLVVKGTTILLLVGEKQIKSTLVPAVEAFVQQEGATVKIRAANDIHERYLFVDRATCYLSGASFKDGPKNAPVTLTQIIAPFAPMYQTYEATWNAARVVRA